MAGYEPPLINGKPTLSELANLYLADSRAKVKSGDVRADQTAQCKVVLVNVIGAVGGQAKPGTNGNL